MNASKIFHFVTDFNPYKPLDSVQNRCEEPKNTVTIEQGLNTVLHKLQKKSMKVGSHKTITKNLLACKTKGASSVKNSADILTTLVTGKNCP